MDMTLPKGRPTQATAEQIVAAYKKFQNLTRVCRELHVGGERANRILSDAGIETKRGAKCKHKNEKEKIPEKYVEALDAYQRGVAMHELARTYSITYAQLYRWMDMMGIQRRDPRNRPARKIDWHCWECGGQAPYGELFCSEKHRRAYGAAAIRPGFKPPRYYRQETDGPCQSTP